jgi:phosphoenolpyruvate---glycerone phosphotransferase subunit DhaL
VGGNPVVHTLAMALKNTCDSCKEELNQLDGLQGDGDLGTTAALIGDALLETAVPTDDPVEWLMNGAKLVRKSAPSTMGTLISFALSAAAQTLKESSSSDAEAYLKMQRSMVEVIQKRGRAQEGDRTLLDAFIPAVDRYESLLGNGASSIEALKGAVNDAERGALQTKTLTPKIGRSSWVGDRTQGVIDGGAWLCFLIYRTIYEFYAPSE